MSNNKISGIKVGTVLADIRGEECSKKIGDSDYRLIQFTYSPYKIIGFDLDDHGNVSHILCNRGKEPHTGPSERLWDSSLVRLPIGDYGKWLFIEDSLGLFNKVRDMHVDDTNKEGDTAGLEFKENTGYINRLKRSDGCFMIREVYILDILKQFFDYTDYIKFTMCSYDVSGFYGNRVFRAFKGPYLLTVDCFRDVIIDKFLKTEDWMPKDWTLDTREG